MPISAYTTLIGGIVMAGSWFLIGRRITSSTQAVSVQIRYLHNFFLMLSIFFVFMFTPNLLLISHAWQFPLAMSWGYAIGHIFLYVALIDIARLFFSMVPRLVNKSRIPLFIGAFLGTALTIANIATMPFGVHSTYNAAHHVVEYNTAPAVGTSIAVFAAVTVFPTAILMIVNGVRNPNARARSFLLGAGLFVLMGAGPIHDTARTAELYAIADAISMVSILLIAGGVLYRFEERLPVGKTVMQRERAAS
jgi:hypothetical protein